MRTFGPGSFDEMRSDKPVDTDVFTLLRKMARMEREMDGLQCEFKAVSASYGDTVLNLVVAAGYVSNLIGNPGVSDYLERHHPAIQSHCHSDVVGGRRLRRTGRARSLGLRRHDQRRPRGCPARCNNVSEPALLVQHLDRVGAP